MEDFYTHMVHMYLEEHYCEYSYHDESFCKFFNPKTGNFISVPQKEKLAEYELVQILMELDEDYKTLPRRIISSYGLWWSLREWKQLEINRAFEISKIRLNF